MLAVGTSDRSTSSNVIVPVASVGLASAAGAASAVSVIEPLCAALSMIGASLVPVIVITTSCVSVPPLPSSIWTVNVSSTVSPAPRKSISPFATL